jgi:predicted adenine nucleotide alpha hydrolase (AANH) superfamily ATPase
LHVCCAPCLASARIASPVPRPSGIFFFNPNIHPLLEFRRREKALRVYLERDPLPAEIVSDYGLRLFLERVLNRGVVPPARKDRCARCYRLRLERTAETARAGGIAAFSTTLLASREQDRALVAEIGGETAARFGLEFHDSGRGWIRPSEERLRGIYKQQYCGCIFSEEERHLGNRKHCYRGNREPSPLS